MTWDHEAPQYIGGPFGDQYGSAISLLHEAYLSWGSCRSSAHRSRGYATVLVLLTTVLAAAAGITVLPTQVGRWVGAAIAFGATLVSLLTLAFNPERSAGVEETRAVSWMGLRDEAYGCLRWINGLDQATPAADVEAALARLHASRDCILAAAAVT